MRIWAAAAVVLIGLGLGGCSREQSDSAAREAGKQAHKAVHEGKQAARKAGRELSEAAKQAKQGWDEADREARAKKKR